MNRHDLFGDRSGSTWPIESKSLLIPCKKRPASGCGIVRSINGYYWRSTMDAPQLGKDAVGVLYASQRVDGADIRLDGLNCGLSPRITDFDNQFGGQIVSNLLYT
jgi:hypothetical protein